MSKELFVAGWQTLLTSALTCGSMHFLEYWTALYCAGAQTELNIEEQNQCSELACYRWAGVHTMTGRPNTGRDSCCRGSVKDIFSELNFNDFSLHHSTKKHYICKFCPYCNVRQSGIGRLRQSETSLPRKSIKFKLKWIQKEMRWVNEKER